MERERASRLIHGYMEGWIAGNLPQILDTLDPDCLIIESHGPTYRGVDHVRRWVETWFAPGSRVDHWTLSSFVFEGDMAAFEWEFTCTVDGIQYQFDGASVAHFRGDRIVALREYRMTAVPYEWTGIE